MSDTAKGRDEADREFFALLWELCEEKLTEQSADRLNELLLADPDRRRMLIEFMQLVAELEWEHSGLGGKEAETATRARQISKAAGLSAKEQPSAITGRGGHTTFAIHWEEGSAPGQNSRRPDAWISRRLAPVAKWLQPYRLVSVSRAAAAALLMGTLCVGVLLAAVVTIAMMRTHAQAQHANVPAFVAKLTGEHLVQWPDDATAVMVDQLLAEGQAVEILSGWAEITFKSGARMVLEGPAKLKVQTADSARLLEGKLATDHVARKVGFTVDTPTGRIVNLGAEFGVAVKSDQTMVVDVFAGAVDVRPVVNSRSGMVGPPERVTANQFIRAVSLTKKAGSETTLERLASSDNHFVRTMRSTTFILGSQCIGRAERDLATGTVAFLRDPTPNSGRAKSFSFYNVHADVDRWITPIILAFDRSAGTYRITGIGQSVLNLGSGLQTAPFQLIVGSADLQAGVHTFGFYHGMIDKTGKATSASLGPLDYDEVPEKIDPASPRAAEARWVFVPGENTPVQLRLDLEFNMVPKSGQMPLWPGNYRFPKERVYSGRLEIVAEPEFALFVRNGDRTAQIVQ